jgi:hypothetical protein
MAAAIIAEIQDLAQYLPRVIHAKGAGGWGSLGLREARGELLCYTTRPARAPGSDAALLKAIACPNVVIKANRKIRSIGIGGWDHCR